MESHRTYQEANVHVTISMSKDESSILDSMLKNKVVVVSGGSSGIGRAAAIACHAESAKLVIHHIGTVQSREDIREMEAMLQDNVVSVPGDIADPKTAEEIVKVAVDRFGGVDVVVSSAGICEFKSFLEVTPDLLDAHTHINYHGAYYLVQRCASQMITQGRGGSIIGVSSISALVGGGNQTHYTPTKAAILSLMQSCAVALGPHGIRANAVLPGTIETRMNQADMSDPEKRQSMTARTALGRLGQPEDVAGPIVFLASDMSRYMTGSQLLVDGGLFVNLQ